MFPLNYPIAALGGAGTPKGVRLFPVLFAIPRTSGWLAQWQELLADPEQKIARPRQIYLGAAQREYVQIGLRDAEQEEFAA